MNARSPNLNSFMVVLMTLTSSVLGQSSDAMLSQLDRSQAELARLVASAAALPRQQIPAYEKLSIQVDDAYRTLEAAPTRRPQVQLRWDADAQFALETSINTLLPVWRQEGKAGGAVANVQENAQGSGAPGNVDTGNDPSKLSWKFYGYWRHLELRGTGDLSVDQYFLFFLAPFRLPFAKDIDSAFVFEGPIVQHTDSDFLGDETGTGDWTMRFVFIPFKTDFIFGTKAKWVVFLPEITVPTGDGINTGGSLVVSPGIGPVFTSSPNWFVASIMFYDFDVAKTTSTAQSVSRIRTRTFFQYAWQNGLYVLPEMQTTWDLIDNTFELNIAPEVGWVFRKPNPQTSSPGLAIYLKGGWSVISDDISNHRDWFAEVGMRVLF